MSHRIFSARRILTMNPSQPEATHIAIRDGRILGVGALETLMDLGDFELDERFADKVILPGFVEGHSHALEGVLWEYPYAGFFPRQDPEGQTWPGLTDIESLQRHLGEQAADLPTDTPLIAWGFDPIYFPDRRLDRNDLDAVDAERPIVVIHANLHMMTVNGAMLRLSDLESQADIEGVVTFDDGRPNGELREMAAMFAIFDTLNLDLFERGSEETTLERYARIAQRHGVTTLTDLYNPLSDDGVESMQRTCNRNDVPMRLAPAMSALTYTPEDGIDRVLGCGEKSSDKLHFGLVKLMTDGSIQGYTARLKWPGYHDGSPNGMWNAEPERLTEVVHRYHQAGLQLHIHTNGDEAVELMLDAIESALELWPRADHRHTLQHCQIIDHAQLKRAARLGVCLNMFANHLYYWGDIHRSRTLGFERCQRLEPLASADRLGIPIAAHCDAPVTPLAPLFTAWCAVARQTASGEVLGPQEALSVERALRLITLDAAYTLKLDDRVGSLEIGKFADMAVLDEDPRDVPLERLASIGVVATVIGGQVFSNV
ncbi:amidohydrolase [Chromohalobacter nigrandesensis]|uniref:amidohydrolase n=1 Tax=Chromohalobacter nigrandesensis TaxID=119863 RepID=UPI001FF4F893|nr:amidohydrolase [Chromohalobacter nigrandesensis]MCK0745900.1 amidohydrolase [Chromohalobacter nigrandesensis]